MFIIYSQEGDDAGYHEATANEEERPRKVIDRGPVNRAVHRPVDQWYYGLANAE